SEYRQETPQRSENRPRTRVGKMIRVLYSGTQRNCCTVCVTAHAIPISTPTGKPPDSAAASSPNSPPIQEGQEKAQIRSICLPFRFALRRGDWPDMRTRLHESARLRGIIQRAVERIGQGDRLHIAGIGIVAYGWVHPEADGKLHAL